MKYITHNDQDIDTNLTHGQGGIEADYSLLTKLFGTPFSTPCHKTDAEWNVEFENGVVATIYNWKNGISYLGKHGTPTTQINSWNVGGYDSESIRLIRDMIERSNQITTMQGHINDAEWDAHWAKADIERKIERLERLGEQHG